MGDFEDGDCRLGGGSSFDVVIVVGFGCSIPVAFSGSGLEGSTEETKS